MSTSKKKKNTELYWCEFGPFEKRENNQPQSQLWCGVIVRRKRDRG